MKSKKEVIQKLKELLADERVHYPAANVFSNTPLALIQVDLESKIIALNWVLEADAIPLEKTS